MLPIPTAMALLYVSRCALKREVVEVSKSYVNVRHQKLKYSV